MRDRIPRLSGLLALGMLLAAPLEAADEGPCSCWYLGYEDGLEFNWDNRRFAENYARCQKQGAIAMYDDGFKAATEKRERTCPR